MKTGFLARLAFVSFLHPLYTQKCVTGGKVRGWKMEDRRWEMAVRRGSGGIKFVADVAPFA
jgi:hypothetical protein